ncbi:hypothetical protein GGS21DRAFT_530184 [Xylaria nigripes]|nr:hypothetical protein GGS21DRAFT_530184 [Xylaria nigripes]
MSTMSDRLPHGRLDSVRGYSRPAQQLSNPATLCRKRSFDDEGSSSTPSVVPNTVLGTPLGSPTQPNTQFEFGVQQAAGDYRIPNPVQALHPGNDVPRTTIPSSHEVQVMRAELQNLSRRVDDILVHIDTQPTQRSQQHCSMAILQRHAAPLVVDDWISTVQSALRSRPPCPDYVAVHWASSHVAPEVQQDWLRYLPTLYHRSEEDVKLEDFWRFIRSERRDPESLAHLYRGQLQTLLQLEDESPMQFFVRWHTHQLRVRPNLNLRGPDSVDLAYHYYFRLHEWLQVTLFERHVRFENPEDLRNDAQRVWIERQDYGRRCNTCRRKGHTATECGTLPQLT